MKNNYTTFVLGMLISINTLVTAQGNPGDVGEIITINSYTTFQGYDEDAAHLGQGEYQIFYDNIDGNLDKPFIIVDGFDPDDEGDINSIYNFMVYNDPEQNYLDELRDEGMDIVILNFPTYVRPDDGITINGGADYIERNALILVNLIEKIKNEMNGNGDMVVVGPSMGGLVSRYALTYMEQNGLDPQTGLWISFDSPHLGANIPISFQYVINYIAVLTNDADMIQLRDVQINSPAAKQMLLDHYAMHLQSDSEYLQDTSLQLPLAHAFRTTFMDTMNSMGFPTQSKNISIVNGSLDGSNIESPGALIMDTALDIGNGFGADLRLHFTPDANISNYEVDYVQPTFSGIPQGDPFYAYAESPSYTAGLDSSPGGSVLFDSLFGENPSDVQQQIIDALQVEAFSFIPTLSSLAIEENNWYDPVDGSESIPFDGYFGNNINEQHLTFNQESIDFINAEIDDLHLNNHSYINNLKVQVLGNPVNNTIHLQMTNATSEAYKINLYNSLGKNIATYSTPAKNSQIKIPSPKVSGIYLVHIQNETQESLIKIVVNH